jgi:hypothetical protein
MFNQKVHLDPDQVLRQTLVIMQPLVLWLLRSGVRHPEFSAAIKQAFLEQASAELHRLGEKQTDSALSMLSGLHRKDVRALIPVLEQIHQGKEALSRETLGRPTVPTQVMTRWLTSGWPDTLPLTGMTHSFEALSRQVSSDIHPRSVLKELVRLDMAVVEGDQVSLLRQAFVPDKNMSEAGNLLSGSTADHLAAGVHNLSGPDDKKFLEQSVFADGLFPESVKQLEELAGALWLQVLNAMVRAAVPLSEKDEPAGGDQRIRVGMFCYSEPITPKMAPLPVKKPRKKRESPQRASDSSK